MAKCVTETTRRTVLYPLKFETYMYMNFDGCTPQFYLSCTLTKNHFSARIAIRCLKPLILVHPNKLNLRADLTK